MNSGNVSAPSHDIDTANLTVARILKALTPSQVVAIIGSLFAICSAAYFLGAKFPPDANELAEENTRLKAVVRLTQVTPDQNRHLPLNKFIAAPFEDLSFLQSIYGGKLYIPPLGKEWVRYEANDLTLLADMIEAPRPNVRNSMPLIYAFNEQNPPQIWTAPNIDGTPIPEWIPYIQISLIPRDRAQRLMEAVNKDALGLITGTASLFRETLEPEFTAEAMKLLDSKLDEIADPKFATKAFFNGALTHQESQEVFGKATTNARRQEKIEAIARKVEKELDARFKVPAYLLLNGMESLNNVTPEAGLLFGRLLFYVFGVSQDGRVDINQLVIGYEGSYAQLSRTIERPDLHNPGRMETFTVVDDVLIMATKSDFCLVHIRVPELDDRLKALSKSSREWMMQVRMREFR